MRSTWEERAKYDGKGLTGEEFKAKCDRQNAARVKAKKGLEAKIARNDIFDRGYGPV